MIVIDSSRRSQSVIRPLVASTYAVLGLVANTTVWNRGTDSERTVTTYVPCLGKLDGDKVVSVFAAHRSDIMTRVNPIYAAKDNSAVNNSGTFVQLVDSMAQMPVGVQPDIWWALKVLPEIRKYRFATTTTLVTCKSVRTGRLYQAPIYKHDIVKDANTDKIADTEAKRKAIQKLADAAGLGTIEGLDASQAIQFADNESPDTAINVDTTRFIPQA